MMPIGPLMIEHRLIERMVNIAQNKLQAFKNKNQVDTDFMASLVNFFRTYADRCHHGKEEDILFRELNKKTISAEHQKIMNELIEEHRLGRGAVGKLAQATSDFIKGDGESFDMLIESLAYLMDLYPRHIEKEDKHFFLPIMEYFSDKEKDALLNEGYEFDKGLIHKVYGDIVVNLEKKQ